MPRISERIGLQPAKPFQSVVQASINTESETQAQVAMRWGCSPSSLRHWYGTGDCDATSPDFNKLCQIFPRMNDAEQDRLLTMLLEHTKKITFARRAAPATDGRPAHQIALEAIQLDTQVLALVMAAGGVISRDRIDQIIDREGQRRRLSELLIATLERDLLMRR